jgi:hypothetical protein
MYIYIVTLLVKNTENISEFLLYYLVTNDHVDKIKGESHINTYKPN